MNKTLLLIIFIMSLIIPRAGMPAEAVHQEEEGITVPDVKTQFFCGYCHVLSYPKVIKKAYLSDRKSVV